MYDQSELDLFQTPMDVAHYMCRFAGIDVVQPSFVLDPFCGRANILDAAFKYSKKVFGNEIDRERYSGYLNKWRGIKRLVNRKIILYNNWLNVAYPFYERYTALINFAVVITNPPFSQSTILLEEVVKYPYKTVVALLPVSHLASQKRELFWRRYPPAEIRISINRFKFQNFDGTDSETSGSLDLMLAKWVYGYTGDTKVTWGKFDA